jgi:N-acetylneuraminate synthase
MILEIDEKHVIGPGRPVFIIAEAGVNHNGDLDIARELVETAARSGADAVKFQTFRPSDLLTREAPKAEYQQRTTDAEERQYDMLMRLRLTPDMHHELMAHCRLKGILFLSTPFEEKSADLLEKLELAVFKIPSGEITNLPFLAHVAGKGRPIILSTGMSCLGEVETAVRTIEANGNPGLALLHCVSNYPARPENANLKAMETLRVAFGLPVGFSDHTPGIQVALAAAALGATVIEKHFTLDRTLPGPDHQASLMPEELKALVEGIRIVESALGDGCKKAVLQEDNTASVARKSLVAERDIAQGTILTREMIAIKRPGTGIAPALLPCLIGRAARRFITAETVLTFDMLV